MFMFTAPLPAPAPVLLSMGDALDAFPLAKAALALLALAIAACLVCLATPLPKLPAAPRRIIASGGPVSAVTGTRRDANGRLRCARSGRFVREA
jgi:hypothetical protein